MCIERRLDKISNVHPCFKNLLTLFMKFVKSFFEAKYFFPFRFARIFLIALSLSLTSSMVLECNFRMAQIPFVQRIYTCEDPRVVSFGDGKNIVEITGNHLEGMGNFDVRGFHTRSNYPANLTEFPRNIGDFFPNMVYLGMLNTSIASVPSESLRFMASLEFFSFSHSDVTSLDGDLFALTRNLRWIWIDHHPLQHVGQGLLTGLSRLQRVDMDHNTCIDQRALSEGQIQDLKRDLLIQCPPLA